MAAVSKNRGALGYTNPAKNGLSLNVDSAGTVYLVDAHGQQIEGVISMNVRSHHQDVVTVTATFLASRPLQK